MIEKVQKAAAPYLLTKNRPASAISERSTTKEALDANLQALEEWSRALIELSDCTIHGEIPAWLERLDEVTPSPKAP